MSSRSSTTDTAAAEPVVVGLIHKPHGIAGEVTVESWSDVAGRFAPGARLQVAVPGVPLRTLEVRSVRPHGERLLIAFHGVDSRTRAEELRGGRLEVAAGQVPPAPEGEFYYFELIGCRCFDGGAEIGEVEDVLEDGGGQILSVREGADQILVPFVRAYLARVDVAGKRIDLDLPEGLLDTCKSRS
jgi:16S rRNA processing protein RimM